MLAGPDIPNEISLTDLRDKLRIDLLRSISKPEEKTVLIKTMVALLEVQFLLQDVRMLRVFGHRRAWSSRLEKPTLAILVRTPRTRRHFAEAYADHASHRKKR